MSKDKSNHKVNHLDFIRVPTRQLKMIVSQHYKVFPRERFDQFIAYIRKVYEQYHSCLAEFEPGVDRAMMAHRMINQSIEQSSDHKSTCSRGCGACCHLEVEVTQDEGKLLAELVKGGIEIDQQRLTAQAARKRMDPEWAKPPEESNRCVFLGPDQTCRVYDFRPLICRKLLVSSPPENCSQPGSKVEPLLIPLAEIALSAAISQPGNTYNSLSKILVSFLDKKQEKKRDKKKKADLPLDLEP